MEPHLRATIWATGAPAFLAAVIGGVLFGPGVSIGVLCGAMAALANYVFIVRQVSRLAADPQGGGGSGALFALRFLLMGAALFGMIAVLKLSSGGVIVGVSMIIPGAVTGLLVGWKS